MENVSGGDGFFFFALLTPRRVLEEGGALFAEQYYKVLFLSWRCINKLCSVWM